MKKIPALILLVLYFFLCTPSKADVVPEHHKWFKTYIDKQGREVKKPDNWQPYQIPLEPVKIDGNNGFYFYTEGHAVIPKCILNKEHKCTAENEKEIMLMCSAETAAGRLQHEPVCNAQSWFNEGLAPVRFDGKPPEKESDYYYKYKSGYINKEGRIVLETDYWELYPFNEGLAQFCINKLKCGFIDKTGRVVIKPKYSYLSYFNNGIAEAHGYIDTRKALPLPAALLGVFILAACALFVFSRRSE